MSIAAVEEILEETDALSPDEQRQVRELLSGDSSEKGFALLMTAIGLLYYLEKRNVISHEKRRQLVTELLESESADAGRDDRASVVRAVRGKYSHLRISSEDFAARKRDELKLEDRL